jgi:hypothetical protein
LLLFLPVIFSHRATASITEQLLNRLPPMAWFKARHLYPLLSRMGTGLPAASLSAARMRSIISWRAALAAAQADAVFPDLITLAAALG